MAKFEFDISELQKKLNSLDKNVDNVAESMIDEALPTVKSALIYQLGSHRDTGDLIDSIKIYKSKPVSSGGYFGYVTASGTVEGKTYKRTTKSGKTKTYAYRNYQKLIALEYGSSHQRATPVVQPAINSSKNEVQRIMKETLKKEMGE